MKRPAAPPAFCPRFLLPEPNKSKHNKDFHEKSDPLVIIYLISWAALILVAARYTYCDEEAVWDFKLSMAPKVAAAIS